MGRFGLEPGQLPVADGLEDEPAQPDEGTDHHERARRGPLEHAGLDRDGGQPQDQGLQQVDDPQRVEVLVPPGAAEQVTVARVLALSVVAPADVGGQPQAPQDGGGQQRVAACGLAVPNRAEQGGHGGQGQADAPRGVDHAVPSGLYGHGERHGHHHQQRAAGDEKRDAERAGFEPAHRSGLMARAALALVMSGPG
jgi:hypothetical protein